ncbi:MAG: transglutaminase-like domain-containing protein [Candidatus Auribacterota bacterium]|nr:transglutaminase-like domain-containing protein [Candidatus Auribacterota bacterium]
MALSVTGTTVQAGWEMNLNNSPRGDKYYLSPDMKMVMEDILYRRFYNSEEQMARGIFDWVENNIEYAEAFGPSTASLTFKNRKGKCAGQARLFIALARDVGINARYALVDVDCHSRPVKHACAWVRLDGKEYLIDPAYGLFGADHQGWRVVKDRSSRLLLSFIK